jgi:hypothetical protein
VLGMIFTGDDVLQHCPSTLAESVCRHARESYVLRLRAPSEFDY